VIKSIIRTVSAAGVFLAALAIVLGISEGPAYADSASKATSTAVSADVGEWR
jgi:hypothetical protein